MPESPHQQKQGDPPVALQNEEILFRPSHTNDASHGWQPQTGATGEAMHAKEAQI